MKRQKTKSIDCTPTWFSVLPVLIMGIKSKKPSIQKDAYIELGRMAEAADKFNESCESEMTKRHRELKRRMR